MGEINSNYNSLFIAKLYFFTQINLLATITTNLRCYFLFRVTVLSLFLFSIWLLWSGYYNPLLLSLGVLSCGLSVLIANRMKLSDEEGFPVEIFFRLLAYLPWLLGELYKSGLEVSRLVLNPKTKIAPRIVKVRPSQRTSLGLMIYANSITLTPGTVTISVSKDQIEVHTLTDNAEKDLNSAIMDNRVEAIEENV